MEQTLRVIARAIIINKDRNKLLLVKNKGGDFWYPPGGGWEYNQESIEDCVIREAKEETGVDVSLLKFMYTQEFRNEAKQKAMIELFWLCEVEEEKNIDDHSDQDENGLVEIGQWFSKDDLKDIVVFPNVLKGRFWEELANVLDNSDKFLKED